MPDLYTAILNPRGPNYEHWSRIFAHNPVPLESAGPIKVTLGEEKDVEVYRLNLRAMTLHQRARLLGFIAQQFGVTVAEVEAQIQRDGFPIRAVDVIVSYDMRAFA